MKTQLKSFTLFAWRVTIIHMLTYSVLGWIALAVFNYEELFSSEYLSPLMRSLDSPWIAAGPGLQVIRGLIFAVVLWPFRYIFLLEKKGLLKLWGLFLGLAIFSTAGPTLGSIEGLIYTRIPFKVQFLLLPELVVQTFAFSALLFLWYKKPHRTWNIVTASIVIAIVLLSLAVLLFMGY